MTLILSVDVEDWAQSTLDTVLPLTARAEANTNYLLDLLAEHDKKMTCFVLGKYAEKFPKSVKRMANEGHEVASHGYGHINIFLQKPKEFREDVSRSKGFLEDLTGQAVTGYRAPNFSMGPAVEWALPIVKDLGFKYDSSIFPSGTYKNGLVGWPEYPVKVELGDRRSIIELPASTIYLMGRAWPVAGGGYFRLLPWFIIKRFIQHLMERDGVFSTYCHPYEFDPQEFREMSEPPSLKVRLHQGVGRGGFERKFLNLVEQFPTGTASEVSEDPALPIWKLNNLAFSNSRRSPGNHCR